MARVEFRLMEKPDWWGDERAWPPQLRVRIWLGDTDQRTPPTVDEFVTAFEAQEASERHIAMLRPGVPWRVLIDDPEGDVAPLAMDGVGPP